MNHKVNSVQNLYDDATGLFNNVVTGGANTSADSIITNIKAGIDNLKGCWEGKDAGVQIQNLVVVHNGMVEIRNALGSLAVDSSKIASNYRNIQNANGAGLEELGVLSCEERAKTEDYSDTRDTVSITEEANQGKAKIDAANDAMDGFIQEVKKYYNAIMENWTVGTGREQAQEAFESFLANSNRYKETLSSVSGSITQALTNYNF
jgi:uncharacterized protein YukE